MTSPTQPCRYYLRRKKPSRDFQHPSNYLRTRIILIRLELTSSDDVYSEIAALIDSLIYQIDKFKDENKLTTFKARYTQFKSHSRSQD